MAQFQSRRWVPRQPVAPIPFIAPQQGFLVSISWLKTGKRPVTGNNVSHAKNRTRRRFLPNLHHHRFWIESEKRFVSLRVSSKGMRIIDKNGIEQVLSEIRARGEKV